MEVDEEDLNQDTLYLSSIKEYKANLPRVRKWKENIELKYGKNKKVIFYCTQDNLLYLSNSEYFYFTNCPKCHQYTCRYCHIQSKMDYYPNSVCCIRGRLRQLFKRDAWQYIENDPNHEAYYLDLKTLHFIPWANVVMIIGGVLFMLYTRRYKKTDKKLVEINGERYEDFLQRKKYLMSVFFLGFFFAVFLALPFILWYYIPFIIFFTFQKIFSKNNLPIKLYSNVIFGMYST